MSTIIVFGSINMDLVVRTPRFPAPGETILGHSWFTVPGGKGSNQAVAVARMGGITRMVGRVGDDPFGERLLQALRSEGVDTSRVLVERGISSGVAAITLSAETGENNIIVIAGANGLVSTQDANAAAPDIGGSQMLLLQLEVPLPAVQSAAEAARRQGVQVVLNAAPARTLPQALLHAVDYLVVNETEAAQLTGLSPNQPEQCAVALQAAGPGAVVVTLGEAGALALNASGVRRFPGFKVRAVDTTAAGDAFVGAFAVSLADRFTLDEAVRRGNAAGALAASKLGAQPSLPTRREVDSFLQSRATA